MKVYLQISKDTVKILRISLGPDYLKLEKTLEDRKVNLLSFNTSEKNDLLTKFKKQYKINSCQYRDSRLKCHFQDRSINLSLIKNDKTLYFFLT